MTVYVDADACPVKDEIIRVAERHRTEIKLVTDGGLMRPRSPWAELVIVPEGPDAADDWIAERIGPGDICVTADIPLADRCVKAGARAIDHRGEAFTAESIGAKLATRNLMTDLRSAGQMDAAGGGRAFSSRDRSDFLQGLERLFQEIRRGR
ncbi:YaiI/YqxD family protein [Marinicauda salina]|uniref:YaiI/YqxD family protein n=1 Tax=Marinicauda salina TaxID=2135793 RepID=UPI001E2BD68A|nr:YaiI/YqxD family protein [Marinicauda salina]